MQQKQTTTKKKKRAGDELENLEIELVPRLDLPPAEPEKSDVLELEALDDAWESDDGAELQPADADADFYVTPGEIVADKYRVEEVLGVGGMAFVVAVTHVELGERFALKFLNRDLLGEKTIVDRFTQEARAACRIRSEHVARVYDVGTHYGAPFFVMEHLEGRDLAMVLAHSDRKGLPIGQAVEWVMQACDALAVAHHHGIIHRDIKPENLFLVEHGGLPSIKLLDFGISKLSLAGGGTSGVDARLTGHFSLGTPTYMSPEQIRSASSADTRSDLWSLGVVLYELLAGVEPFRAPSVPELCAAVAENEPKRVSELRPEVPPALAEAVHKCLEKNPDDRFAHVAELAMALLPFAPSRALVSVERSSELMKKTPTPSSGITPSSQRMKAAAPAPAPAPAPAAPAAPALVVEGSAAVAAAGLPDLRVDEEEDPSPHSGQPVSRSVTSIPPAGSSSRSRLPMFAAAAVLLVAAGFAAIRFGQPLLQPIAPDTDTTTSSSPQQAQTAGTAEAPQVAIRAASFTREKEREPAASASASPPPPPTTVVPALAAPAAAPTQAPLPIILPSSIVVAPRVPASKPKSSASALPLAPQGAPGPGPASASTIELGY
jgi:eukaryotic-like serine/threonine-protein kinase